LCITTRIVLELENLVFFFEFCLVNLARDL
jgi:hypothetical protein